MEPRRTPHNRDAASDECSPMITLKLLFERYDLNHSRALPFMPAQGSKRVRRTAWSRSTEI